MGDGDGSTTTDFPTGFTGFSGVLLTGTANGFFVGVGTAEALPDARETASCLDGAVTPFSTPSEASSTLARLHSSVTDAV